MSVLLGDIERARAAHDIQRHLDLDQYPEEDENGNENELPPSGGGDGGGGGGTSGRVGVVLPSAYLLDFRDGEGCKRRDVTPGEFGNALRGSGEEGGSKNEGMLLVLRGLPAGYLNVISEVTGDVDPSFVEAHAERRCYRPRGAWRGYADFENWEYPELVQGFDPAARTARQGEDDIMTSPKICSVGKGDLAAVFCRASMWMGSYTPILFLDRPIWRNSVSGLRKAQRGVCVVSRGESNAVSETQNEGDPIPSLESLLQIFSLGSADGLRFPRSILLEELVFDLWLELFELLAPPTHQRRGVSMTGCLWQMLHSLELNEDASSYQVRRRQKRGGMRFSTSEDWSTLLARVNRRSTLLSASPLVRKPILTPSSTMITTSSMRTPGGTKKFGIAGTPGTGQAFPPGRTPGRSGRELLDENHRALDRISYLGGILIPLPIVSSILSMGDTFGPDGDKFFIFWAVSLPLSLVAVMIVYADTIRKAEVWVEVASEHAGAFSTSADTEGVGAREHGIGSLWHRRNRKTSGKQDEEAQMPPEKTDSNVQPNFEKRIVVAPETAAPLEEKVDERFSEEEEAPVQFPMLFSLGPGLYGVQEEDQPDVILEPSIGGSKPRAWQRKKLGWGGAMKTIVSRRKPRYCHEHSPEDLVAHEAHEREREKERGVRN